MHSCHPLIHHLCLVLLGDPARSTFPRCMQMSVTFTFPVEKHNNVKKKDVNSLNKLSDWRGECL